MKKEILEAISHYLSKDYINIEKIKNKIIILHQSDPYIVKIKKNKIIVRRQWFNIYLIVIVGLIIYSILQIIFFILPIIPNNIKLLIWLSLMIISIIIISHNNKCQKKTIKQINKKIKTYTSYHTNYTDT